MTTQINAATSTTGMSFSASTGDGTLKLMVGNTAGNQISGISVDSLGNTTIAGDVILSSYGNIAMSALSASLLSTNGYQKFPGGLIIQWGTGVTGGGAPSSAAITFPIAFPTAVYNVTAGGGNQAPASTGAINITTSGCTITAGGGSATFFYIAIGH